MKFINRFAEDTGISESEENVCYECPLAGTNAEGKVDINRNDIINMRMYFFINLFYL